MEFQKFGFLVVLDLNLKIDGFTENVRPFLESIGSKISLGARFDEVFAPVFRNTLQKVETLLVNISADKNPRTLFTKRINDEAYYFSIYKDGTHIQMKWELQIQKKISTSHLNDVAFLLEKDRRTSWDLVCKAIRAVVNYDRVIVLQIDEHAHSKVIAESIGDDVLSMREMEFSPAFMPLEVMKYYERTPYSYVPDIDADPQGFVGNPGVDGYTSVLTSPPSLHTIYCHSIGVKSAVMFPLYFNNKLWGIILGHHHRRKRVDLHNQKLSTFIAQAAMNNYENRVKQRLLDINEQIVEFKYQLVRELNNNSYTDAIVGHIEDLRLMMRADGVAIYDDGATYYHGLTPDADQFYDLISYLQKNNDKTVFKDHNFKLNRNKEFSNGLPFAGVLAYNIDANKEHYIIWFRKEQQRNFTQVELVEQDGRKTIKCVDKTELHSAVPWNEHELTVLDGVRASFNELLLYRNTESLKHNKELSALNNELEMLTHTISHDLKNPLSVLKMGLKYLEDHCLTMEQDERQKWYKNLSQSIVHIQDIVDNTIQVSSRKAKEVSKEAVPMNFLLRKIAEESLLINQATHCKVSYGKLLPIWGERSALYQIFLNVISNAIKYSKDQDKPAIHIKSTIENGSLVYCVSDNGIGIPQEVVPRVFDMFVRAENAEKYPGTGIGLALVKRMIERMEGQIVVVSEENKGTSIKLYFAHANN